MARQLDTKRDADVLPNVEHFTLAGQTHIVKAVRLALVVAEFLKQ